MKAFITGINGFVGSHLAEHLLSQKYEVAGSILPGSSLENLKAFEDKVELIRADIRDPSSINAALSRTKPSHIYHLAALSSVADSLKNPRTAYEVNVLGAINLLESVRELKDAPVTLLVGSADVYGNVEPGDIPIKEDQPLKPLSPYAVSKAAVDMMGYQYFRNFGLKIVRTRSFNHTGARQSETFAVSAFAKQIAEIEKGAREPVIKVGDLDAVRDFTHVRDVVIAYRLLMERGVSGEAYNVCSSNSYSIGGLLDILLKLAKRKIEVRQDKERLRASDIGKLCGDNAKLQSATGWQAKEPIEVALEDALNWWRNKI